MYADAVTTVVLEVQSNPKAQKGLFDKPLLLNQCKRARARFLIVATDMKRSDLGLSVQCEYS